MRVFVTGAAGYIGSHTLIQLLGATSPQGRFTLCAFDNFCNSSANALLRVQELTGDNFATITGDMENAGEVLGALSAFNPDAVIHLAGLKAVAESCTQPLRYYRSNLAGTLNLLDAMDAVGCQRMVFSSSATVYGAARYLPIDEAHPIAPSNPYGRTKAMVENVLRDWCNTHPNASAVSLRYFNPVGAHSSGRIGEDPRGVPNNLMPYLAQLAIGRREHLPIYGTDYATRDGTGERDYIHVEDLAAAHLAALAFTHKATGFEAINVGTGSGHTVKELLCSYERACGKTLPIIHAERRPGDTASSYAATDKAARLLGWEATRDLETMCTSSWRWQSLNPYGFADFADNAGVSTHPALPGNASFRR